MMAERLEWCAGRPDRDGWHPVGYVEVETTRSGEIKKRRGVFWVHYTTDSAARALELTRMLAEAKGDLRREQTLADLRHPMFADEAVA